METNNTAQLNYGNIAAVMPDGTPAPYVLTPEEAIKFLRLDDTEHPENTLRYYHDIGLLKGTYIGKRRFYTVVELCQFVDRQTKENRKSKS